MPIVVCGLNHKTAPIALREKVTFPHEKLALFLQDLQAHEQVQEAVLLSTCNRSELYCDLDDAHSLIDWFCRHHFITRAELEPMMYFHQGQSAVEHIMQVACGLDSMVLGESQILGQMKVAFSESCAAGTVGPLFNKLFQQVFAVAKEVRTNTAIGACPVSVSSAAVNFISATYPGELSSAKVLLIGAGLTMDLVLRHLKPLKTGEVVICNRSVEHAKELAQKYENAVIPFSELASALTGVDIIITATSSATPIITKSLLSDCRKPVFIVDIAVPRNVDVRVTELSGVLLYSIDDLKNIIQQNMRGREHAAEKAQEVIKQRSSDFISWLASYDLVATTIRNYRNHIESIRDSELSKAMRQLQRGEDASEVLAAFAYAFTQKLLHTPSVQLRQAGAEGRFEFLQLAQELFAIT